MEEVTRAITWEAPEHNHYEKSNDWFWVFWILSLSAAIAMFFFGNFLFAVLIVVGAATMALVTSREPSIVSFAVTARGVLIDEKLYPYNTLESFNLDEENPQGPQLLIKSKRVFMPLLILPIPPEYLHEIDDLIGDRLPEEDLEEPLAHKLLEFFGF